MNNIYTDKLKAILDTYVTHKLKMETEKDNAKATYLPATADEKIKEICEREKTLYRQATDSVVTLFNELKSKLSAVDFPAVENLSADRYFFDGTAEIDLTLPQIEVFIERYKNNHTMLKIISKWIDDKHSGDDNFNDWTVLKNSIPTVDKQLKAYTKIFKSAISMINTISQGAKHAEPFVKDFCNNDNASFWDIIGNGQYLTEVQSYKLPVGASHIYDDITIA